MHPAFMYKAAAIAGPPGPSKPVSPNGIKPLIIGTRLPSNGGPGQEGIDPAQMDKAQQDTQAAQNATQAAKNEAQAAQHQLRLSTQLHKHQMAMAQRSPVPSHAMDSSLVGSTVNRAVGRLQKLQSKLTQSRIHNGLLTLNKQADASDGHYVPGVTTRSGAPWPVGVPAMHAPQPPISAAHLVPHSPSFTDYRNGLAEATKDVWRSPAQAIAQHATFTEPLAPMSAKGEAGTVDAAIRPWMAPVANGAANTLRHLWNGLANGVGAPAAGAVGHLLHASVELPGMAKELWKQPSWNPLDWKTKDLPNTKAFFGHGWDAAKDTASTLINTSGLGMGFNTVAGAMGAAGVTPDAAMPAQAPAPPAQEQATPAGAPTGEHMNYLAQLWQFLQPYLQGAQGWGNRQLSSLPSVMGAGGHQVRDVRDYFR